MSGQNRLDLFDVGKVEELPKNSGSASPTSVFAWGGHPTRHFLAIRLLNLLNENWRGIYTIYIYTYM